jgi:acetyl/propionyl-CoA carboxylase alpha subunit
MFQTFRSTALTATNILLKASSSAQTTKRSYFSKVLVANRGEIASRVFRTCQRLDIPTVAVYCTTDTTSNFVQEADEAICIGPPDNSYLNIDRILAAIRSTGATAVHPGYGFLSENAHFAQAVNELDVDGFGGGGRVKFLGPSAFAIQQLGDKLQSKRLAAASGVSIVPGHDKPVASLEEAMTICGTQIPYPVLVKVCLDVSSPCYWVSCDGVAQPLGTNTIPFITRPPRAGAARACAYVTT